MELIDTICFADYTTDILFSELKNENKYENSLFITDSRLYGLYGNEKGFWKEIPKERLLVLNPGEQSKNADSLFRILDAAFDLRLDRDSFMVAVGGGVLTDLTGLAASLFKRGCRTVFYPTTLLAMVDASVGGKTGIDYRGLKNMIGTFYPAEAIRIDMNFLRTLSDREYRSGLGEVIKTAMLGDHLLFELLRQKSEAVQNRDPAVLKETVARCIKVKSRFVREDLREHGVRAFLNWGHTFAHAFETVSGLGRFSHGEAVIWGIDKGLKAAALSGKGNREYEQAFADLVSRYGFCVDTPVACFETFQQALSQDKKKNAEGLSFVLQSGPCKTFRAELSDELLKRIIPVG